MPTDTDDGWDWHWLYFVGIYIFRLSEEQFWRLTPKKLWILSKEYQKYNSGGEGSTDQENKDNEAVYIDQLW